MGDEQQGQAPDLADEAPARKWGDPLDLLDEERKTALAEAVWEWMPAQATPEQSGPFAWQRLDGLEVFWLAACVVAGRGGDTAAIAQRLAGDTFTDRYSIDLSGLHLEGAILNRAHLAGSNLYMAHLEGADLYGAHLAGAYLVGAHLEGTTLSEVHLEGGDLGGPPLAGANPPWAPQDGGRRAAPLAA